MASETPTLDDLYETAVDLATCTTCLEPMKTPKHLQCFHTFCQTCISAYCKSQCLEGSEEKVTLACPVCRLEIVVKESGTEIPFSSDIWAEKLPSNCFIVELLERAKIENRVKHCVSCERLGEKNEAGHYCVECAELYCSTCCKYHQAQKSSISHTLKEVTEVSTKDMKSFQQFCPNHQGEILKLYCSDHDIECCCICVSVDHRKCETVKTLEHAAKDIRDSEILKTVSEDLQTSLTELKDLKEQYSQDGETFQEKILSEIEEINIIRSEIKEEVDAVSDQQIAKLTQYLEDYDAKYMIIIDAIESRINRISNEQKTLSFALEKASNVQVMAKLKELVKQNANHKESVVHLQGDYFHVDVNSNTRKEEGIIRSSLENMFVSSIAAKCEYPMTCNTLMPIQPSKICEIELKGEYNEGCFTSDNSLCVANYHSKCIEIYNLRGRMTKFIQLTYEPYHTDSDGEGSIAVFNRNDGIVEIFSDRFLKVERSYDIGIKDSCKGIALSGEYFVLSSNDSVSCYEREKGTIVKQLSHLNNVSLYACIDEKGLYYSCNDIIYFQSILKDENAVVTDENFKQVQGIVINKQRNMLLAEMDLDRIVQISSDRTSSRIFLSKDDGIYRPRGIDLSVDQNYLLVMNSLGHSVLVFKEKQI